MVERGHIMTLDKYFSRPEAMRPSELARAVGVARQAMTEYRKGRKVPRLKHANRIHSATNGLVTPKDLDPEHEQ